MAEFMKLHILASGSKGNASVVEGPQGLILIDDGISRRALTRRGQELGIDVEKTGCVIITHEHSDHISGLSVWCHHWQGRIVASPGTAHHKRLSHLAIEAIPPGESFVACGMRVTTFATSHDVAEPCGMVFETADDRLAFVTDTGVFPECALPLVRGARIIALESNHDPAMLRHGSYPAALKARVGGSLGHLSNAQAAEVAQKVVTSTTEKLVAMHISQQNNLPSLAVKALAAAIGAQPANSTFTRALRVEPENLFSAASTLEILAASQDTPMTVC